MKNMQFDEVAVSAVVTPAILPVGRHY